MTIKSTIFKVLLTSFVLTSSVAALAKDATFKIAVVKDAIGTKNIIAGDLTTSINQLTNTVKAENTFDNNMGLCVAYLQNKSIEKSESACTAAINSTKSMSLRNERAVYLKSLSYSNRGISRFLNHNFSGALEDLTIALSIDSNPITENNLKLAIANL